MIWYSFTLTFSEAIYALGGGDSSVLQPDYIPTFFHSFNSVTEPRKITLP